MTAASIGKKTHSSNLREDSPVGSTSLNNECLQAIRQRNSSLINKNGVPKASGSYMNGFSPARSVPPILDAKSLEINSCSPSLTPVPNAVHSMRQHLEHILQAKEAYTPPLGVISPVLKQLRNTPGNVLQERQQLLQKKHAEVQSRCNDLNIGGGVCMWPGMQNMRLARWEIKNLIIISVCLFVATVMLFNIIHGSVSVSLHEYTGLLHSFPSPVHIGKSQTSWDQTVLQWHRALTQLVNEMKERFSVSLGRSTVKYQAYVILYILGMATLLYLLADNIFSKNKLSPKRIKIWVCLLVVLGTWTLLILRLLFSALSLEDAVLIVVINYRDHLSDLVYTDLDLKTYNNVLLVWQMCCLPPIGQGTLSILGLIQVRDVVFYLQIYSLPIITAFLTPVCQLILAMKDIYSTGKKTS